jgi:hypothetical protein
MNKVKAAQAKLGWGPSGVRDLGLGDPSFLGLRERACLLGFFPVFLSGDGDFGT